MLSARFALAALKIFFSIRRIAQSAARKFQGLSGNLGMDCVPVVEDWMIQTFDVGLRLCAPTILLLQSALRASGVSSRRPEAMINC